MTSLLKIAFFALLVRPLVLVGLGLNLRGREHLPLKGPAVVVANHNSHLDTLVLMSLFPLAMLPRLRPVAAADYFVQGNRFLSWFSRQCIGIIPLDRSGKGGAEFIFADCYAALDRGEILVLFPEGSRGSPEKMGTLKKGIHRLLKERQNVPVIPVMLYGLGRALPKGEALFVPFNCDVAVGAALYAEESATHFLNKLTESFAELTQYLITRNGSLGKE